MILFTTPDPNLAILKILRIQESSSCYFKNSWENHSIAVHVPLRTDRATRVQKFSLYKLAGNSVWNSLSLQACEQSLLSQEFINHKDALVLLQCFLNCCIVIQIRLSLHLAWIQNLLSFCLTSIFKKKKKSVIALGLRQDGFQSDWIKVSCFVGILVLAFVFCCWFCFIFSSMLDYSRAAFHLITLQDKIYIQTWFFQRWAMILLTEQFLSRVLVACFISWSLCAIYSINISKTSKPGNSACTVILFLKYSSLIECTRSA